MKRVTYLAEAQRDVILLMLRYEMERPGLGREFLEEVVRGLQAVFQSPEAFRTEGRGLRRYVLHRFSHRILYRVDGKRVVVVACLHVRREYRGGSRAREAPPQYV